MVDITSEQFIFAYVTLTPGLIHYSRGEVMSRCLFENCVGISRGVKSNIITKVEFPGVKSNNNITKVVDITPEQIIFACVTSHQVLTGAGLCQEGHCAWFCLEVFFFDGRWRPMIISRGGTSEYPATWADFDD